MKAPSMGLSSSTHHRCISVSLEYYWCIGNTPVNPTLELLTLQLDRVVQLLSHPLALPRPQLCAGLLSLPGQQPYSLPT